MNQKLRTARRGMVLLFAVLCIVCLSLSLILSAHFAAYAADESVDWNFTDEHGQDLWLVHYNDGVTDKTVNLTGGESIGNYLVNNGNGIEVAVGSGAQKIFTPFRGEGVTLSLRLNPDYTTASGKLGDLYKLDEAVYNSNATLAGNAAETVTATASVRVTPRSGGDAIFIEKQWSIATLCNTLTGVSDDYITNRVYAQAANYNLLAPRLGDIVVYDISANGGSVRTVAVKTEPNGTKTYYQAGGSADSGFSVGDEAFDAALVQAAADENVDLINYIIRRLDALMPNEVDNTDAYTLTVAAMPVTVDGVYYAQSSVSFPFSVAPQQLGNDGDEEINVEFGDYFTYNILPSVSYDKDGKWLDDIGFTLKLNGIELVKGTDYTISSDNNDIGNRNLMISGTGNVSGYHTILNAIRVTPAKNDWEVLPNVISWMYGTYSAENNVISARPVFLDNPEDVKFRIVARVKDGDTIRDEVIDALSDIHYYVYNDSEGRPTTNWNMTDDVIATLKKLNAGNYRLYASVYGSTVTDSEKDRNYQPLEEKSVDFTVFKGANSWEAGAEPTILGWTAGKLATTDGLINAKPVLLDEGEETILMIYRLGENGKKDTLIYSNVHGVDASSGVDLSDINLLKGLKAGRYYLSAEVKETANYTGLKTTVLFDVVPNNLPVWAVILIVVGSLGVVAVVFIILHQKGILQMLTGKVILSMRTRANVDATLAAIRAAKVARDAEASIAAAKAREAEENAKAENPDKK